MRVPVCLSACFFVGLNPRTVPQLSLNKFRAPLGSRGLVLGLNVSSFVLWVLPMEHVQSGKLDRQPEVADIITSQKIAGSAAGPSWKPVSVPAGFLFSVGVAVDAT